MRDRLPASLEELKASKGGLVTFLFLSGKEKEDIAKELKTAFKLTDDQAGKIVRCHRADQNQPLVGTSKPASLRWEFHNRFLGLCK
ncbi:MAG: hypothetical protein ACYDC1_15695 [Limisphaerales bacterium]